MESATLAMRMQSFSLGLRWRRLSSSQVPVSVWVGFDQVVGDLSVFPAFPDNWAAKSGAKRAGAERAGGEKSRGEKSRGEKSCNKSFDLGIPYTHRKFKPTLEAQKVCGGQKKFRIFYLDHIKPVAPHITWLLCHKSVCLPCGAQF